MDVALSDMDLSSDVKKSNKGGWFKWDFNWNVDKLETLKGEYLDTQVNNKLKKQVTKL